LHTARDADLRQGALIACPPGTDLLIPTSDYVTSINAIAAAAPTDIADHVNYWVQALVVIDQSVGDYIQNAPIDTADILSSVSSSISFLA
jgi:hypothetical protein